ncbi:MAG: hypothetical protein U5J62_03470 [Desulfurivibrio sp.]|nr:hypothetical protein [Desulfurivibrio sp.]
MAPATRKRPVDKEMKTGVYFCNCGRNVSGKIHARRVEAALAGAGDFYFRESPLSLSPRRAGVFWPRICAGGELGGWRSPARSPREHQETFPRGLPTGRA